MSPWGKAHWQYQETAVDPGHLDRGSQAVGLALPAGAEPARTAWTIMAQAASAHSMPPGGAGGE